MNRKVVLVDYDPRWPDEYLREVRRFEEMLGDLLVRAYHIGSTAIPGMKAKPIIDILLVVTDLNAVDDYNAQFSALGYECFGENGIEGRRFFPKGGDNRSHHVHVYQLGSLQIARHVMFRDYMREHSSERSDYLQLKQELASRFHHSLEKYSEAKNDFIRAMDHKASAWYEARQSLADTDPVF